MNKTKYYHTKQKSVIRDFLISHQSEHLTADEMLDMLKSNETPVGKATLYRFLDTMVSGGEVKKYMIDNGSSCFQYIGKDSPCQEHYHLKCNKCGQLFHINSLILSKAECAITKQYNFEIDQKRTIFYGICQKCQGDKQ